MTNQTYFIRAIADKGFLTRFDTVKNTGVQTGSPPIRSSMPGQLIHNCPNLFSFAGKKIWE